jgi:hypothetical protein
VSTRYTVLVRLAVNTAVYSSGEGALKRPHHAKRIAQLAVAVAPEHDLQRHDDFRAGVDRPIPRLVHVVNGQVQRERLRLLQQVPAG